MNDRIDNLKKMQEMIPDYVFDRLRDSEKEWFERQLPDYPEIHEEVKEAKAVFDTANLMDYDRIVEYASQNISVKVNKRLASKKKSLFPKLSPAIARFAMPLAAVVAFGYWGYETDFWGTFGSQSMHQQILISDADFETLFDDDNGEDLMQGIIALEHAVIPTETEHIIPKTNAQDVEDILEEWVMDGGIINDPTIDQLLEYEIEEVIQNEEEFQLIYGES